MKFFWFTYLIIILVILTTAVGIAQILEPVIGQILAWIVAIVPILIVFFRIYYKGVITMGLASSEEKVLFASNAMMKIFFWEMIIFIGALFFWLLSGRPV